MCCCYKVYQITGRVDIQLGIITTIELGILTSTGGQIIRKSLDYNFPLLILKSNLIFFLNSSFMVLFKDFRTTFCDSNTINSSLCSILRHVSLRFQRNWNLNWIQRVIFNTHKVLECISERFYLNSFFWVQKQRF